MNNNEVKVLVFKVNEEYFAADIMEVERILGYEETTKIPEAPYFIDGVRNYEGNILPVMILAKKFNVEFNGIENESKVIVTKNGEQKIGILVDSVSEVINVQEDVIEKTPDIASGISKKYVKGLIKLDDRIIIFLNLNSILSDEEKASLEF
ncbi:chemotaxis protein CheW [Hathewaya limosa]|uniref:Purine-binding chemotaxis protein CheW n=1 Tax=Hathewaya limosa TaxID=1536 RepID=A0ABU0JRZ8_HATLI|nr:chemotaxis protein CheW [Hathewaya limosa]MDQ0479215.1 purine-binding chemotaxis protein CheW [Hathewaya limosa]